MIYYKEENGYITKFDVQYNAEELESIRDNLIRDCSRKTHVITENTISPEELINPNKEAIEHLQTRHTGKIWSYSDISEDKVIYEYDYVHILYPRLAYLITELLQGNNEAIYQILEGYQNEEVINYAELITNEKKDILELVGTKPNEAINKIKHIQVLEEEKGLNKYRLATSGYYDELISKLEFVILGRLSTEFMNAYNEFFDLDSSLEELKLSRKKETSH